MPQGAEVVNVSCCLTQEYKVSSCEQRLISEIEYRLERSPVDESGDEVQHGDVPVENGVAPFFEMKLKHYKIFEGMPVTFTCRVTGNPKPKVSSKHGFLGVIFSEEASKIQHVWQEEAVTSYLPQYSWCTTWKCCKFRAIFRRYEKLLRVGEEWSLGLKNRMRI